MELALLLLVTTFATVMVWIGSSGMTARSPWLMLLAAAASVLAALVIPVVFVAIDQFAAGWWLGLLLWIVVSPAFFVLFLIRLITAWRVARPDTRPRPRRDST